jgi:hypothetical protein
MAALIRGLGRQVEVEPEKARLKMGRRSRGISEDANNRIFGSPTIQRSAGITVTVSPTSIILSLVLSNLTCQEQDS